MLGVLNINLIHQIVDFMDKEKKNIGFELSIIYKDSIEHERYFNTKEELIEYLNKYF